MQDETPRVDLGKRNEPGDPVRTDGYLGARRGSEVSVVGKVVLGAILLLFVLIAFLLITHARRAPSPPPAAVPASTPPAVQVRAVETEVATAQDDEQPAEETVDPLETARDKICRSIASDFVDAPSPTQEQMRRTLTIYNLNECSNRYIRDKDAEARGLDKDELEAIQEQESVGPLRLEDK